MGPTDDALAGAFRPCACPATWWGTSQERDERPPSWAPGTRSGSTREGASRVPTRSSSQSFALGALAERTPTDEIRACQAVRTMPHGQRPGLGVAVRDETARIS
ncbi:hypothetical protein GCM10010272_04090 [Streptomyces lateritius]|nr:hypothetical protein GCM10010272_04090 [Streptomyces lateritius]